MQVKILRILQDKIYEPLGGTVSKKADVRIIAATNKSLSELVKRGNFREDLFYRLNVIKISLPPLSQRREDIPLLVDHFLQRLNAKQRKTILGVHPEVMDLFMTYEFPGNIRELENILEYASILCHGSEIQLAHLPGDFLKAMGRNIAPLASNPSPSLLRRTEVQIILETLQKNKGNRKKTAQELGINQSTLWRKMKKWRINL